MLHGLVSLVEASQQGAPAGGSNHACRRILHLLVMWLCAVRWYARDMRIRGGAADLSAGGCRLRLRCTEGGSCAGGAWFEAASKKDEAQANLRPSDSRAMAVAMAERWR